MTAKARRIQANQKIEDMLQIVAQLQTHMQEMKDLT
jgi:hypothetical protein